MRRLLTGVSAIALAYAICAASGLNRWMYIWLKGFYVPFVLSVWVVVAIVLMLFGETVERRHKLWALSGIISGYLAGVVAYQLAPAVRDGSFVRSVSTINVDGLTSYLQTSAFYPILCLTPIVGVLTIAIFLAFARRTPRDRYVAATVAGVTFLVGWAFFLSRGSFPPMW